MNLARLIYIARPLCLLLVGRKGKTRLESLTNRPLVHEAKGTLLVQPSTRNPITTDQFSR